MKRIAVFPGSFDPFTKGHQNIVERFLPLFDEVIIAIGVNQAKRSFFSLESRKNQIQSSFKGVPNVSVLDFSCLTIDLCKEKGAQYLLRGIRNASDSDYEQAIAQMNAKLSDVETIFLMCDPQFAPISSSIVREIKKNQGDITQFVTNDELLIIE